MTKKKIKKLNLGFELGDYVEVDNEYIYYSYTQFIKRHRKWAACWQYKRFTDEKSFPLRVIGIHKHTLDDKYDKNKYCVVVQDQSKRIFLAGELGITLLEIENTQIK